MKRPELFEIYRTAKGEWHWRITSSNGRIIGASTEGYRRQSACRKNFTSVTGIKSYLMGGRASVWEGRGAIDSHRGDYLILRARE